MLLADALLAHKHVCSAPAGAYRNDLPRLREDLLKAWQPRLQWLQSQHNRLPLRLRQPAILETVDGTGRAACFKHRWSWPARDSSCRGGGCGGTRRRRRLLLRRRRCRRRRCWRRRSRCCRGGRMGWHARGRHCGGRCPGGRCPGGLGRHDGDAGGIADHIRGSRRRPWHGRPHDCSPWRQTGLLAPNLLCCRAPCCLTAKRCVREEWHIGPSPLHRWRLRHCGNRADPHPGVTERGLQVQYRCLPTRFA
mmetsp:Transcript_29899/g.80999  ORF Transcript_29899/g.80999 Transcript_29899/m.80999 type:complete len:250 (-) Transcript_29899:19-768(-)